MACSVRSSTPTALDSRVRGNDEERDNAVVESQVARIAMGRYDYHSFVEEAQPLLDLLRTFDALVERHGR